MRLHLNKQLHFVTSFISWAFLTTKIKRKKKHVKILLEKGKKLKGLRLCVCSIGEKGCTLKIKCNRARDKGRITKKKKKRKYFIKYDLLWFYQTNCLG